MADQYVVINHADKSILAYGAYRGVFADTTFRRFWCFNHEVDGLSFALCTMPNLELIIAPDHPKFKHCKQVFVDEGLFGVIDTDNAMYKVNIDEQFGSSSITFELISFRPVTIITRQNLFNHNLCRVQLNLSACLLYLGNVVSD